MYEVGTVFMGSVLGGLWVWFLVEMGYEWWYRKQRNKLPENL